MATEIIRPTGIGTYTELIPSTGANWSCVDEDPASDTDYVYYTDTGVTKIDTYVLGNPINIQPLDIINKITVYVRTRWANYTRNTRAYIIVNGTDYDGYVDNTDVYTTLPYVWTLNPKTSAPWTLQNIIDLEAGIAFWYTGSGAGYCSQIYVEIDYTPVNRRIVRETLLDF